MNLTINRFLWVLVAGVILNVYCAEPALCQDYNKEQLARNERILKSLREEVSYCEGLADGDDWIVVTPFSPGRLVFSAPAEKIIEAITIGYYKDLVSSREATFDRTELERRIRLFRDISEHIKRDLKNEIEDSKREIYRLEMENYDLTKIIASNDPIASEVIQIGGDWNSNYFVRDKAGKDVMVTYTINQKKDKTFDWSVTGPGIVENTKNGKIEGKTISILYNRTAGPHQTGGQYRLVEGTVITDRDGNYAVQINWLNGAVWKRP